MKNLFLLFIIFELNFSPISAQNDSVSASFKIGQIYGGGIIFYIDSTGQHGLITTTTDFESKFPWSNDDELIESTSHGIGIGYRNTVNIITHEKAGDYAAYVCYKLAEKNYTDWFLPSKDELNLLFKQKKLFGNFNIGYYWSSTENFIHDAWYQDFNNGNQNTDSKTQNWYVRPIRAF